jgi:uncharacterized damage-inducible protein DinB
MEFHNEIEAYSSILLSHFRQMAKRLRQIPPEKWDFTFSLAAPTPRILAIHALEWMQCDRQHIQVPDHKLHHTILASSSDPESICSAIETEADLWEAMLNSLTPEDLDREGTQFGIPKWKMTTRGFIAHMIQNVIYKHGQFSTMYFAFGLDGNEPYSAPFPNSLYEEALGMNV